MSVFNQYDGGFPLGIMAIWNETDVSQFIKTVDTTTGTGLSVDDNVVIESPTLQVNFPLGGGTGDDRGAVWVFDPAQFRLPIVNNRFIIEVELSRLGNSSIRTGIALGCDAVDQGFGIRLPQSGISVSTSQWEGTYLGSIGGTSCGEVAASGLFATSGARGGARYKFLVEWTVASPIEVRVRGWSHGEANALNTPNRCSAVSSDWAFTSTFNDPWVPTTAGLFIQGNGVGPADCDFSDFIIRQHPEDITLS